MGIIREIGKTAEAPREEDVFGDFLKQVVTVNR